MCQGITYTHNHIRGEANAILKDCLGCQYEKAGKHWVNNFLYHHNNQLCTYWSAPLPSVRAKAGNKENIAGYFVLVKEQIADPKVPPECVWSTDKTQATPTGSPCNGLSGNLDSTVSTSKAFQTSIPSQSWLQLVLMEVQSAQPQSSRERRYLQDGTRIMLATWCM